MMSYFFATESNTPRTRVAFSLSSTVWKPKWVWLMAKGFSGGRSRRRT